MRSSYRRLTHTRGAALRFRESRAATRVRGSAYTLREITRVVNRRRVGELFAAARRSSERPFDFGEIHLSAPPGAVPIVSNIGTNRGRYVFCTMPGLLTRAPPKESTPGRCWRVTEYERPRLGLPVSRDGVFWVPDPAVLYRLRPKPHTNRWRYVFSGDRPRRPSKR